MDAGSEQDGGVKFLVCSILLVFAAPLMADAPPLKLELIAPDQPVIATKAELKNALAGKGESRGAIVGGRIELTYRITNTGKEDITFNHGGDSNINLLELKGHGAVINGLSGPDIVEFSPGKPITLHAGKSREFTIKGLCHGVRDMMCWSISKPGEYEVTMVYKGDREDVGIRANSGFELKSNVAKFTVVVK